MLAVRGRPGTGLHVVQPLIIERRFNGPPDSGNGGYVCGLLATAVNREVKVRLRVSDGRGETDVATMTIRARG